MGSAEWYLPTLPLAPVRVQVRCEYPGSDLEPTVVDFFAGAELGRTPAEVDAEIMRRLELEEFDLPAIGEATPLPFISSTVRSIAVW